MIRDLIRAEVEREQNGIHPSYEQTEVTACRLILVNLLKPIVTGKHTTEEAFDRLIDEIGSKKRSVTREMLHRYEVQKER